MRVSLFGLFLRCTSLMGPWLKLIQSILLIISFISDFLFYDDYVIPVHTCYTCIHTCAHPASPLGFYFTTRLGSFIWLPWILMSRSWSLKLGDSPACWSEMHSGSVDHQQTVWGPILLGPLLGSRLFPLWLVSAFYTVHYCISLCILAFAPSMM